MKTRYELKSLTKTKNESVMCIINFQPKELIKIYTGITLTKDNWDKHFDRSRKRFNNTFKQSGTFNDILRRMDDTIERAIHFFESQKIEPTKAQLKNQIYEFMGKGKPEKTLNKRSEYWLDFIKTQIENAKNLKSLAKNSIQNWSSFYKHFEDFEMTLDKRITFDQVDNNLLVAYLTFVDDKFLKRWGEHMHNNSLSKLSKGFARFVSLAKENGISVPVVKVNTISPTSTNKVFLSPQECKEFFSNGKDLDEKLINVRNLSYILLCTGVRFGDLEKVLKCKIIEQDGIKMLSEIGIEKTDVKVSLPVFKPLEHLFKTGLPWLVDHQEFNEQLKSLFFKYEFNEEITVSETRGGESVEKIKYKYELMAAHSFRYSFINMLLSMGVSETLVKSYTHPTSKRGIFEQVYSKQKGIDNIRNTYRQLKSNPDSAFLI